MKNKNLIPMKNPLYGSYKIEETYINNPKRIYMKKTKGLKTKLKVNESYKGETIEAKIRRMMNNKEPISDGAPLIYTDRKEGVRADMDIRTDRFDVAIDGMDAVNKSYQAKRDERHKPKEKTEDNKVDKVEPTKPGTGATTSDSTI